MLSATVIPGTFLATVDAPEVGAVVVVHSRGRFRHVQVTAVGPKRIRTEYVTTVGGTVTRPSVPRGEVYVPCYGDDPNLAGVVRERSTRAQHLED